jgi:hypothetical protein
MYLNGSNNFICTTQDNQKINCKGELKMIFDREISPEMTKALDLEYENGGWWRELADHDDMLIAIRNKYLNVYCNGCNIAKVEYKNNNLTASIHYKYLLKKEIKKPYIECKDGQFEIASHADLFISSFKAIKDIKYSTKVYGGIEKTGVHQIIRSNLNVVDTEIAFSAIDSENKNSRIDFCAIQEEDGKLILRFFEAKDYSNNELKTQEGDAKVIAQLTRYQNLLTQQNDAILTAYKKLIRAASEINGRKILGKDWATHPRIDSLELDHKPSLVVFGFDDDQKNGDVFKKHMKKLSDTLDTLEYKRLLLKGDAKEFKSGISTRNGKTLCPFLITK